MPDRLSAALLLLPLLLLAAAGCRRAPAPAAPAWHLALALDPPRPGIIDDVRFTLRVTDAQGRPVNGAAARLDLAMATMDMGTTSVPLAPAGPGLYAGTGHFTMGGAWNCAAAVSLGGRTLAQTFRVVVG